MTFFMSSEGFKKAVMAPRRPVTDLWASRPPMVKATIAALTSSRLTPNSEAMGMTCPIVSASSLPAHPAQPDRGKELRGHRIGLIARHAIGVQRAGNQQSMASWKSMTPTFASFIAAVMMLARSDIPVNWLEMVWYRPSVACGKGMLNCLANSAASLVS